MFNQNVLNPILESIDSFSNRNAFVINEESHSYLELSKHISKIRTEIQNTKFTGKNIGLVANDDIETYASIIAIWLEGFAYVPIHPKHPVKRGNEIIEQAKINIIIDSSESSIYPETQTIQSRFLKFEQYNLKLKEIDESELAYILFTSGSTGKPKGVQITRLNVGAFMEAFWVIGFDISESDRCLQCFDLTFDVSVQSYLTPLCKGACAYTIPHDQIKYNYASVILEEEKITFAAMAPSMVRFYRPYFDEIDLPYMRYNILTAEASPLDLVEEWSSCVPNAEIFDLYGPTEATIYCTYNRYEREKPNKQLNGMLSIGKPFNGIDIVIKDEENNLLEKNIKGELCVAGNQVTVGYWENESKNKEAFIQLNINGLERIFYRTGDACYIDDDGDLMLSGRLDYQVKIQGYRIELGEIEHHAREFLNGHNAVALAFSNQLGTTELALFIEGELLDQDSLVNYLKSKMPHYMVPLKYYVETEFPLNANGKVDRNKLHTKL